MFSTPGGQLIEHPPGRSRIPECRRSHLDGISPGHEQLYSVHPAHDSPDSHDGGVREGGPTVVHGPDCHWMDGGSRKTAAACAEDGTAAFDIDGHTQHRVHQ